MQWSIGVAGGSGDTLNDGLQDFGNTHSRFSRCAQYLVAVAAKEFHNLVFHEFRHSTVEVTFVDHGDDLEVVVDGHIEVRDGLCLDALRSIDNEQCAFAGSNGAAHFVAEVNVTRSVDEVEDIFAGGCRLADAQRVIYVAWLIVVVHLDGVALDSDATFALQIHIVENLRLHVTLGHSLRALQQTICQSGFAVVNVCDDTEVADIFHSKHYNYGRKYNQKLREVQIYWQIIVIDWSLSPSDDTFSNELPGVSEALSIAMACPRNSRGVRLPNDSMSSGCAFPLPTSCWAGEGWRVMRLPVSGTRRPCASTSSMST